MQQRNNAYFADDMIHPSENIYGINQPMVKEQQIEDGENNREKPVENADDHRESSVEGERQVIFYSEDIDEIESEERESEGEIIDSPTVTISNSNKSESKKEESDLDDDDFVIKDKADKPRGPHHH